MRSVDAVDIKSYAKQYVQSFARKQQRTEELRVRLIQEAVRLAQTLRTRFGATQVVLFGSVLDAQRFTPSSDIDLVVEGLSPEGFWQAVAYVQSSISFKVDLIDLASARPTLLQRIQESGRVLL